MDAGLIMEVAIMCAGCVKENGGGERWSMTGYVKEKGSEEDDGWQDVGMRIQAGIDDIVYLFVFYTYIKILTIRP